MIIGFDMDGVLCEFSEPIFFHVLSNLPDEKKLAATENYFRSRKPLLNPELLCSEGDEYHVITGRQQDFKEATEDWCRKYAPNAKSVNLVGGWAP